MMKIVAVFFMLVAAVKGTCVMDIYTLNNCQVTSEFAGGTQYTCDEGFAYCCDPFTVSASKAQTFVTCPGVSSASKWGEVSMYYETKYLPNADEFRACPYVNDIWTYIANNGVGVDYGGPYVADGRGEVTAFDIPDPANAIITGQLGSQLCDYNVTSFLVFPA
jgi:hypothetical protein